MGSKSGKYFVRPYLEKTHHKKRAGRVAQGIGTYLVETPVPEKKKK
jgi:hypothetical protein